MGGRPFCTSGHREESRVARALRSLTQRNSLIGQKRAMDAFVRAHEGRERDFELCITSHLYMSAYYWGLTSTVRVCVLCGLCRHEIVRDRPCWAAQTPSVA
jgi:hypothetical protein